MLMALLPVLTAFLLVNGLVGRGVVPLIVWVFLPPGRRFEEAPRGALVQGRVTPALAEAFSDPVVAAAHAWELIAIGLIIVLMVTKPF
jgi:hypothetical protein